MEKEINPIGQDITAQYLPVTSDKAISELAVKYKELNKDDYKVVIKGLSETRDLRISVEKKRKELKAGALEWGRTVDSEAKRITQLLVDIENPLKLIKSDVEEEKARIKAEKEEKERDRISAITARVARVENLVPQMNGQTSEIIKNTLDKLNEMTIDDTFQEFAAQAKEVKEDTVSDLEVLLARQIEAEAEEKRKIEDEARKKAELEEQQAKLKIEREEFEAEKAKQQAETNRIAAEQKKIDDQKAAIEKEKQQKIESDRVEKEEKAETERQTLVAENKRLEDEKRAAAEYEKAVKKRIAMLPDKKKLEEFAGKTLPEFICSIPVVKSVEAIGVTNEINSSLEKLQKFIWAEIETL